MTHEHALQELAQLLDLARALRPDLVHPEQLPLKDLWALAHGRACEVLEGWERGCDHPADECCDNCCACRCGDGICCGGTVCRGENDARATS
jgi:hypothetical protein